MPYVSSFQWAVIAASITIGLALSAVFFFLSAWLHDRRRLNTFTVVASSPGWVAFTVYVLHDARTAEEAIARVLQSCPSRTLAVALPGDWSELQALQRLKS
jgi:hypothetical protein